MRLLRRKQRYNTTLPPNHPLNYLGTDADPVVLHLPVFGQVLILVEAPAPEFLGIDDIYGPDRKLFSLGDVDVIPSAYYKRNVQLNGYVKAS